MAQGVYIVQQQPPQTVYYQQQQPQPTYVVAQPMMQPMMVAQQPMQQQPMYSQQPPPQQAAPVPPVDNKVRSAPCDFCGQKWEDTPGRKVTKGNCIIGSLLGIFGLIPGLIYCYCTRTDIEVCKYCLKARHEDEYCCNC